MISIYKKDGLKKSSNPPHPPTVDYTMKRTFYCLISPFYKERTEVIFLKKQKQIGEERNSKYKNGECVNYTKKFKYNI